jgi:hypothetical protein
MEFLSLEECSLYNANYLGLPLFINQKKKPTFEDIKAKVLNRVSGWKAKTLSRAARSTLIKLVASSLQSFPMSMVLLPNLFSIILTLF